MTRKGRLITVVVLSVSTVALVAIVAIVALFLFSRSSQNEIGVSDATAVGAPVGPATKKSIGPLGGSMASSDGRVTLAVPPNDLSGPVEFVITPITNQAPGGLGNAYRFEPNGQKFATPVEISFKYTAQELEGTIPEALLAAHQEQTGGWRMFTNVRVDEAGKFLTVPTTHFTDMSLGKKFSVTSADKWDPSKYPAEALVATHFRVSPAKATIHPGESVRLDFIGCENETVMAWSERLLRRWDLQTAEYRCFLNRVGYVWNAFYVKHGTGSVYPDFGAHVLYTAPSKKPIPNVVGVQCGVMFNTGRKIKSPDLRDVQHFWQHYVQVEGAEITIVDRGYTASGNAGGDTVISGDICDLEKTFTLETTNPFLSSVEFKPDKDFPAKGGKWSFSTQNGVIGGGGGEYTITGTDTLITGIEMKGTSSAYGQGYGGRTPTLSGSGPVRLDLKPLNECKP